jgi:hypothetical protein
MLAGVASAQKRFTGGEAGEPFPTTNPCVGGTDLRLVSIGRQYVCGKSPTPGKERGPFPTTNP